MEEETKHIEQQRNNNNNEDVKAADLEPPTNQSNPGAAARNVRERRRSSVSEIIISAAQTSAKQIREHIAHVGVISITCSLWCIFGTWVSMYSKTKVYTDMYYHPADEEQPLLYSDFKSAPAGSPEGLNYQNMTVLPYNDWECDTYFVQRFNADQYRESEAAFADENPIFAFLYKNSLILNSWVIATVALNLAIFQPTNTGMAATSFHGCLMFYLFALCADEINKAYIVSDEKAVAKWGLYFQLIMITGMILLPMIANAFGRTKEQRSHTLKAGGWAFLNWLTAAFPPWAIYNGVIFPAFFDPDSGVLTKFLI